MFKFIISFFDILMVQGKYQTKPPFPFVPGAELAGTIVAAGPDVTEFKVSIYCKNFNFC